VALMLPGGPVIYGLHDIYARKHWRNVAWFKAVENRVTLGAAGGAGGFVSRPQKGLEMIPGGCGGGGRGVQNLQAQSTYKK
jgi:hypothetical protein